MPDRRLKIFLSSTAQDLTAFRKAVHTRLAASPLFDCIRQEDFGAQPHPPVELCRQQVLQSDLFIGLIGMRRGWEPPGDQDRRSITEMEYDWAKDVTRFMYVTRPSFPVPGDMRETDDEHQRQLSFRARAKSELVVSQDGFASPAALANLIVDRLIDHVLKEPQRPRSDDALKGLPDAVAERILQLLDQRGELTKAARGGLERDVVLKLARRLKPDDTLDFDRAVAEVENAITIALDAIARDRRGSNEDDFVDEVLKRVAAHTQAGENERAVQALDDALTELDTRAAEQSETLKRSRLTLLQAGIAQDILRRDAASAARRVEQSVAVEHPDDLDERLGALRARQDEFYVEGRDRGVNFSLQIAIEIARRSVAAARGADQRGLALNDLGLALWVLGERESGTARLEEAVAAFRAALEQQTRERAPHNWAMTQNNLGSALYRIGERESGTARFEQAVAAHRAALEERTRERAPLDWATTQSNLGNALLRLGERESGTARLDEAVAAYRAALEERTREHVPLEWATTQHNLGNALLVLGERESGTVRLEQAVAAYRTALEERTRERVPISWALSAGNQGEALMRLADRRSDAAMAATAVEQIEQALALLRDAGRVPLAEYYEAQLPEAQAIRERLAGA